MGSPPTLPSHVVDYSSIPPQARPLYELDTATDGYRLTPGGAQLSAYRKAIAQDSMWSPPIPRAGREPKLTKSDWATLIAVATPTERQHFLKRAAAGHLKIEG